DQGVIRQIDTPEKVYNAPVERFVASFLGDANFIEGELDDDGRWNTPFGPLACDGAAGKPAGALTAMIRPERIRISTEAGPNTVPAVLTGRSFTGESCEWEFEAAGRKIAVTESAPPERKPGGTFHLGFPPEQLIVLR
ncbi:MAG: TOBE domain-containing protein, partial [Lentisphaeria bacterium]|nr:TOBE domain-containing protein [Lentisphaeria bacterium]